MGYGKAMINEKCLIRETVLYRKLSCISDI
jgi:hypothetical protein